MVAGNRRNQETPATPAPANALVDITTATNGTPGGTCRLPFKIPQLGELAKENIHLLADHLAECGVLIRSFSSVPVTSLLSLSAVCATLKSHPQIHMYAQLTKGKGLDDFEAWTSELVKRFCSVTEMDKLFARELERLNYDLSDPSRFCIDIRRIESVFLKIGVMGSEFRRFTLIERIITLIPTHVYNSFLTRNSNRTLTEEWRLSMPLEEFFLALEESISLQMQCDRKVKRTKTSVGSTPVDSLCPVGDAKSRNFSSINSISSNSKNSENSKLIEKFKNDYKFIRYIKGTDEAVKNLSQSAALLRLVPAVGGSPYYLVGCKIRSEYDDLILRADSASVISRPFASKSKNWSTGPRPSGAHRQ